MPQPLNWNDLRFFLAVARSKTISLAGRRTGTDHATVSRRIDALERALGIRLFERNPRGYNLTSQGEALQASAEDVEARILDIESQAAGHSKGMIGSVRLSTPEGFGNFFLARRIGEFAHSHPLLSVELITIQQIVALSRRETDIAITMTEPSSDGPQRERLVEYDLGVFASEDYLRGRGPIKTRNELSEHPFVGYVDDLIFSRPLDYLKEVHPGVRAQLQNSSIQAQMAAAESGFGLCVLPHYVARRSNKLIPLLPREVALRRAYWMVTTPDVTNTGPVRQMQRFLRQAVAEAGSFFDSR